MSGKQLYGGRGVFHPDFRSGRDHFKVCFGKGENGKGVRTSSGRNGTRPLFLGGNDAPVREQMSVRGEKNAVLT